MSRHSQSDIDALAAALVSVKEVTPESIISSYETQLVCESSEVQLAESHELFHKAHAAGSKLPVDKLKDLHQKAHRAAAHHWGKYSDANSIIGHPTPENIQAKIHHGAEYHKYSNIKNGLEQAIKDRSGSAHVSEAVTSIKGAGNRTIVSNGEAVGSMIGYVDRIPHVDIHTTETNPEKDTHHAYAKKTKVGKSGLPTSTYARVGAFTSHDRAVDALKKFHKID